MKLSFSAESRRDPRAIARHGTLRFGVAQATAYAARIARSLKAIQTAPQIAAVKLGYSKLLRVHPVGSHLIVYEIAEDRITVVRVLHAHQNLIDHI